MDNEESTSSPANDASTPTYVNRSMRLVYFHVLRTMFNYCGIVPHYVEVKFFEAHTMAVSVHGKLYGSITPFAVHYEEIRIHLCELTTNSTKMHS